MPTGLSADTSVGRHCTVGAGSLLRSVTVQPEVVIGQRCILLEGSIVESGSILLDGTLLPPGRRIPAKQVWGGSPARYVRDVTYDEASAIVQLSAEVGQCAEEHKDQALPEVDFHVYAEAARLRESLAAASLAAQTTQAVSP